MQWEILKNLAQNSGLPLFAALPAQSFKEALEADLERRAQGRVIPIETRDPKAFYDPFESLPACQSILIFGLPYGSPLAPAPGLNYGYRSKSAQGLDYHQVLKCRMGHFLQELESLQGLFQAIPMVDTGPINERVVAQAAGLGYIGKNQALITPEYGSWVFLGVILVDFKVEDLPEPSIQDACGSCRACIQACPTKALADGYDPRRCLSWISQKKTPLTEEESSALGNRIYGCDSCQEFCPKNSHIKDGDPIFTSQDQGYVHLPTFLALTKKEFQEAYGQSSWTWRGQSILKRNALFALENADCLIADDLKPWLDHPSPIIRSGAEAIMKRIEE